MARPGGQLRRAIVAIAMGPKRAQQRERALSDTITGEYEQQVHVGLSGNAGSGWGSVDQDVAWELPFLYAPSQRRVPFLTPHFTYGVERTSGTEIVVIHAQVIDWAVTDEQWYVGATVQFQVAAPNLTDATTPFSAVAHLSFQGYGTTPESDEFNVTP